MVEQALVGCGPRLFGFRMGADVAWRCAGSTARLSALPEAAAAGIILRVVHGLAKSEHCG